MKKLSCILSFLLPLFLQAQQTKVDSLENILKTTELSAKERLPIYDWLSNHYVYSSPEKSIDYGKRGLNLAEKEKDKKMIAHFCVDLANALITHSPSDSVLILYNRAIELSKEIGDRKMKAEAVGNIGIFYFGKNKEEALKYFLQGLTLYESIGDEANSVRLCLNISAIYSGLHQNEQTLRYLERAKSNKEVMNNPAMQNMPTAVYSALGGYYLNIGDYKNALENSLISLDLSRKNKITNYEVINTQLLAGIYSDGFHDYDKAEQYAQECLKAAESSSNQGLLITAWNILAKTYTIAGKYEEGKHFALKSWNMDSISSKALNAASSLSTCYLYLNDKEKAAYYFSKQDSLRIKESENRFLESMSNMEVKYETEKKEMRIATLEEERKLYIGLGIAVAAILLLGVGLLLYRHRLSVQKQKMAEQQIRQLEQEKELIAARSALDAEKAEREIIARDLHDGVGAMLSVVKNNMTLMQSYSLIENKETEYFNKALDGLERTIVELRRVAHHIMPPILVESGLTVALDDLCRSVPKAEFHCVQESVYRFDPEKELVLYRCAYELMNNVLRHANASHIDVHFNTDNETAYLSVVDNGCGFDLQTTPQGMGIKNMHTRLTVFGGSIEIYSEPGKGTEANVELKMHLCVQ